VDYKILKRQGVTVLELIIVVIIIGIISGISFMGWQVQLEKEYANNAKATLRMLWQAEENYFSWKGRYTNAWENLEIDNPNNTDKFYDYKFATTTFPITAQRKGKSSGFTIDQEGTITSF